jgi:arylsulfatase A-like enzyme
MTKVSIISEPARQMAAAAKAHRPASRSARLSRLAAWGGIALLTGALGARDRDNQTAPTVHGVILISIDTLRFDHLGYAGSPVGDSPNLDAFRGEAINFPLAIAQSSSTLTSHAAMLTSLLVPHHGASFKNGNALAAGIPTLAEALQKGGVTTASFNDGGQLAPEYELGRGFDRYLAAEVSHDESRLALQVSRGTAWLRRHDTQPFFLFLHTYEVHHPYTPDGRYLAAVEKDPYRGTFPADSTPLELLDRINNGFLPVSAGDLRHVMATYDAQILSMDEAFGSLIAFLKHRGIYDTTAIIFTSDHGEEFGEHGKVGWHSHTLFDELVRVPLLVHLPGGAHGGATVPQQVRSIDIAPTILRLYGLPPSPHFEGRDLLSLVAGTREPARLAISNLDGGSIASLRSPRWKLIGAHLFDLTADRGETHDVAGKFPEIAACLGALRERLLTARPAVVGRHVGQPSSAEPTLTALGYIGNHGPGKPQMP